MKVSDVVARYLSMCGVEDIFGYQGGAITHMIDSFDQAGIRYIQTYNEQGASLAADAYARVVRQGFGVAIATNGPGATNMVTGIANAYCDSVPVLFLTGQVHTFAMKKSAAVRQESFQEIDIISIVKSITKYAVTVMDKNQVLPELQKAIRIAKEGRPGPVLVDIPVDIQGEQIEVDFDNYVQEYPVKDDVKAIDFRWMNSEFSKPIILAGGGIRSAHAEKEFEEFVKKSHFPVVTSLMGLDCLNHKNSQFVGFIGGYGNRYANLALQNADLILVLGSRLDARQTGKRKDLFAPTARIVHVDIDETELGHFVKEDVSIQADLKSFLSLATKEFREESDGYNNWIDQIETWKRRYPDDKECQIKGMMWNPNTVLKHISGLLPKGGIACSDVGQNQMWLAQSLRGEDIRILNSGGLGAMGYSLPAAIGACFAYDNQKQVYAFMGDGGLQMNIQELQVIGQYHLPIKVIVWNNHALGLIRDIHEKYYNKNYVGSVNGFAVPDLECIAKGHQLNFCKVVNPGELDNLQQPLSDDKPWLIELDICEDTYVRPELLGPDGLDHQYPYKEMI